MLRWRPDGVNIAVIFNSRDQGPSYDDIWPELDDVTNNIETWPEPLNELRPNMSESLVGFTYDSTKTTNGSLGELTIDFKFSYNGGHH